MARAPASLDWSLVQAFLAVAEHGSLSAAARVLGASQPTLGRQVRALERQLGVEIFRRHDRGLALSEVGQTLLGSARAMGEAAHGMALRAAGEGESLAGTVRITASEAVSQHHLPAIVAGLRVEEPQIAVELVPSDETSSLHHRQADIAIRMYRPKQLDLVAQHVGDLSLTAFAARTYVERRGAPERPRDLVEHDVVGLDASTQIMEGFRLAGLHVDRDFFRVRTDDGATYFALVRAGCGIGFAQRAIVAKDPSLVALPMPLGLPALPVWLTAHAALRRTPRVDRVWTCLAAGLRKIVDAPAGRRRPR